MAHPSNYGRLWGQIPNTAGQVFWVAPAASYTVGGQSFQSSDDNDGLDPQRALRTIDRAWNLVTADAGDVIVLLPGAHSIAASIAADVAGVNMMGLPAGKGNFQRQKTSITITATDQIINVTAADVEIGFLHLIPITTESAIDATDAADRLHIHNCSFDMATAAADTGTIGIDFISGAADVLIEDCYFHSDGAQGAAIVAGACLGCIVARCVFMCSAGTWVSAMTQAAAGRRLVVQDCVFDATSATITNGCLGTTGGDVDQAFFIRNVNSVGVTKMVDGYDGGDAVIAINYIGTLGGGTGGTLVTLTT